ncbi:MAG TPA: hypothetical protein VMT70_24750 [Vicinamibacteria bacterium]|nr:hypothetical protein [Vicinamibacteria bacterium]
MPIPADFGLTEAAIQEIRDCDRRQAELFVRLMIGGCGVLWLALAVLVYAHSARRAPLLGLVMAPLLGGAGAVIGSLPIAVLSAAASWLAYPRHPQSRALEKYEAATAHIRVCEVCRWARGDATPKEGVVYCARCGAWICPDCRGRYDLRAIAALRRQRG